MNIPRSNGSKGWHRGISTCIDSAGFRHESQSNRARLLCPFLMLWTTRASICVHFGRPTAARAKNTSPLPNATLASGKTSARRIQFKIYATAMIASTIDAGSKSKFGDCEADLVWGSVSDMCVALQQYHPHIRNLSGGHHAGASR